jgi:hypothetical protein
VPLSDPTAIVDPELTVGKFGGSDCSVPVGLLDKVSVPAPVLSVVRVLTVVPSITTSSGLLAVAPVTLTVSFVVVVPL